MKKRIQYFMTKDKTQRIVNYTLWLYDGEEQGELTFSSRETPDDVWGPPITMKLGNGNPVSISEGTTDLILFPQGFTHKEVIE